MTILSIIKLLKYFVYERLVYRLNIIQAYYHKFSSVIIVNRLIVYSFLFNYSYLSNLIE